MIISKKPPYSSTTVDPERTQAQINKLLRDYGISKYQWTNDFDHNKVLLSMMVEAEIQGVKKEIQITIEPPTFAAKRSTWNPRLGKNEVVYAPNWAQSYRLLFYWLKAKIEAVAYGLTTIEKEFLSQVMMTLPTGEQKTVGAILEANIVSGRLALEHRNDEATDTTVIDAVIAPQ